MVFSSKTPRKPLRQKAPLQTKAPLKAAVPTATDQKRALQKSTLRALERAKKAAAEAGVDLSEWENDFIDSVSERVKTYGRAFADPDKGAMNGTLSLRQGIKLKEIRKKAKGLK